MACQKFCFLFKGHPGNPLCSCVLREEQAKETAAEECHRPIPRDSRAFSDSHRSKRPGPTLAEGMSARSGGRAMHSESPQPSNSAAQTFSYHFAILYQILTQPFSLHIKLTEKQNHLDSFTDCLASLFFFLKKGGGGKQLLLDFFLHHTLFPHPSSSLVFLFHRIKSKVYTDEADTWPSS